MYICIHMCTYIYIYTYMYICIHMYTYIYIYTYMYMYVCMYVYTYTTPHCASKESSADSAKTLRVQEPLAYFKRMSVTRP